MYFFLDMYLQWMLFWFYTLLLAIYMRNLTYLCIMVWIHMDIYVFFENMNVLCIFAQPVFWSSLLLGFCPVPIRFWFSGSAGLTSGSAFITLGATGRGKPVKAMDYSLAAGLGLSRLLEPRRLPGHLLLQAGYYLM